MRILSVAYPLFPVNADACGGAEQILHLIERRLVMAGHESFVVAAQGSQVSGTLIPTEAAGLNITEDDRRRAQRQHLEHIGATIERERIDLLHFHGLDFDAYLPRQRIPSIATLHLPASWYPPTIFSLEGLELVCVSQSQAATVPSHRRVTVIENGVDSLGEDPNAQRGDTLLWLGRICPEKGTHIALRVAHRLDLPLIVAGPVHAFASHREYFCHEVEPLLDERRRHIGPVGKDQKARLLRQAKALLIPSLAPETSSLVAMEAISTATPIVAFASGALPEVVEHGVAGYIVDSEEQMAEALGRVNQLSMQPRSFGADRMFASYLSLYERLINNRHF